MPRLALVPGSRPRLPRAAVAEQAIEMQVAVQDAHRASAPLWEAAIRTGDHELLEDCKALAVVMRQALVLARAIAGRAEPPSEPEAVAA